MACMDLTLPAGDGIVNIRVGAIIMKRGRILMAGDPVDGYMYSVGGRVHFGESAEEAIRREVREETGVPLEIDHLAYVHEEFYRYGGRDGAERAVHEIAFYFRMKTPPGFEPASPCFTENGHRENLSWIDPFGEQKYYPEFFRTELAHPVPEIRHIVTREA